MQVLTILNTASQPPGWRLGAQFWPAELCLTPQRRRRHHVLGRQPAKPDGACIRILPETSPQAGTPARRRGAGSLDPSTEDIAAPTPPALRPCELHPQGNCLPRPDRDWRATSSGVLLTADTAFGAPCSNGHFASGGQTAIFFLPPRHAAHLAALICIARAVTPVRSRHCCARCRLDPQRSCHLPVSPRGLPDRGSAGRG